MSWKPYTKPINEQKIISWLSIFSSLCDKEKESLADELKDMAFEYVEDLYKKYPPAVDTTNNINEEIQIIAEKNKEPFGNKDKVSLGANPPKPWFSKKK